MSPKPLTESVVSPPIALTEVQTEALVLMGLALKSKKSWWGEVAEGEDDSEESRKTAIRVQLSSPGYYNVVVYNAVGVIGLPGLQLVVKPKIGMKHLLYLLGSSLELPAESVAEAVKVGEDTDLFELIARWFLNAAEKLLRLGLDRGYERRTADLAVVRGRVDPLPTIRAVYAGRPRIRCEFDSFTEDTSLNRTLKAAARAVAANTSLPATLRTRGRRIAEKLNAAGELHRGDVDVAPDRNRPHYRDAHQLAVLIVKSTGIVISNGSRAAQTFLLRTPDAVEEGVRCALSELLPTHLAAKRQKAGKQLNAGDINGSKKRKVTPDLVFGDAKAVGDVKYANTNGNITTSHLYQATMFATAYGVAMSAVVGFGEYAVDATVQVGKVAVRGFRWATELEPKAAASQLAREVAQWLEEADVRRAVDTARRVVGEPLAPVAVRANEQGYVVDFIGDNPFADLLFCANLSVYVDKKTGDGRPIAASDYSRLMPTLHPL